MARNDDIADAVNAGRSMAEVGREYGLCRERIRQIMEKRRRRETLLRKHPWLAQFSPTTQTKLARRGIYSERDVRGVVKLGEPVMRGLGKRTVDEMNRGMKRPVSIGRDGILRFAK